jgi:hypothetical protein
MRSIPTVAVTVATDLATDRRRRSPKLPRDRPDRDPRREQISDHDPLLD